MRFSDFVSEERAQMASVPENEVMSTNPWFCSGPARGERLLSMERIPLWVGQKNSLLLCSSNVHYLVHKTLVRVLKLTNPMYNLWFQFLPFQYYPPAYACVSDAIASDYPTRTLCVCCHGQYANYFLREFRLGYVLCRIEFGREILHIVLLWFDLSNFIYRYDKCLVPLSTDSRMCLMQEQVSWKHGKVSITSIHVSVAAQKNSILSRMQT
jgi:hypothetical protein